MMWFLAVLVVLTMGAVAVVAAGRGTPLREEHRDRRDVLVPPDGPLSAADLRGVRFTLAFRGYRMDEVDALLERLAQEREPAAPPVEQSPPVEPPAPVEPPEPRKPAESPEPPEPRSEKPPESEKPPKPGQS